MSNIVGILRSRADRQANHPAYTFLRDGEIAGTTFSYEQLDRTARTIGGWLQASGYTDTRALLLYPPGIDYIAAFLGCLYARVVPLPAYPPHAAQVHRSLSRLRAIIDDAEPSLALTISPLAATIEHALAQDRELQGLRCVTTDTIDQSWAERWQAPTLSPSSLAFLQYTSGSTATPKGVMVSHGNLLHNQEIIQQAFEHAEHDIIVGWLPLYHDMGLIGNVLQPLYVGAHCILMAPLAFLQKPVRWLQAISTYRATTSGGPNFAYDLCVHKVSLEQRRTLDLSSWRNAFNGAEPIRATTLDAFVAAFEPHGFRRSAFLPCYGLAEATLLVTGGSTRQRPRSIAAQAAALEQHQVISTTPTKNEATRTLVSCGTAWAAQSVRIVDPQTSVSVQTGCVGEVWIAGRSVAQGYWNSPEQTRRVFQAHLADTGDGPFLRTGDLGFLDGDELFITGRLKDVIIIRGRNYYPQDIELTVEQSYAGLRPGGCAAFAIEHHGIERLVVVQEVERRHHDLDSTMAAAAVRRAVAEQHELPVHAVVFIRAGSLLKTTSGKLQRHACRAAFLEGALAVIGSSILKNDALQPWDDIAPSDDPTSTSLPDTQHTRLVAHLQTSIAALLNEVPAQIDPHRSPIELGVDSLMVMGIVNGLQAHYGVVVAPESLLDGSSISQIAAQIAELLTVEEQPKPRVDDTMGVTAQRIPPIPVVQRSGSLPLSFAQQRLWFLDQLAPQHPWYNIAGAVHLAGELDRLVLQHSIDAVVSRHEALRTTFPVCDGQPVQVVAGTLEVPLPVVLLPHSGLAGHRSALAEYMTAEARRPFDLARGPLLRTILFDLGEQEYVLLVIMHHIIADSWSIDVVLRELSEFYKAATLGQVAKLPRLQVQYPDFAAWQREWLQGPAGEAQRNYWRDQLGNGLPVLALPTDRPRPTVPTFQGASLSLVLARDTTNALKTLSRREGVTLFMTLLAIFATLLYHISRQQVIVVGAPIANRIRRELEHLIGYFSNTLILRMDLTRRPRFRTLLRRVRDTCLSGYTHQDLPFDWLVKELQPARSLSHMPFFQVLFVFQNSPWSMLDLPGVRATWLDVDTQTAKYDLSFYITETQGRLDATLVYATDLFDEPTAANIVHCFATLAQRVIAEPDIRVDDLDLEMLSERRQAAMDHNEHVPENRKRFLQARPQSIKVTPTNLVKMSSLDAGQQWPLVVEPATVDVELASWAANNRQLATDLLHQHGALLFRGFKVPSVDEFERVTRSIDPELLDYIERSTPRKNVSGKVYTSTEYPADQAIPLHNELSYSNHWPLKIWFFCVQPAEQGGETPLADSRKVFQAIDAKTRDRFAKKGVMYVRNFSDQLDLSWQEVFQTDSRQEVEEFCRTNHIAYTWKGDNHLRTWQTCPAVARHPSTGEMLWFNQAHLFHISSLDATTRTVLLSTFDEADLPRNSYYGDGSPIEDGVLDEIRAAYNQAMISFPWHQHDLLLLDNMLIAHGRNPFAGKRMIAVAMAEMTEADAGFDRRLELGGGRSTALGEP